jgi:hypothetical protein
MVEPARVYEFCLPGDTFEVEAEARNDREARMVGGCGCAPDAMNAGPLKCKMQARICRFRHIPASTGLYPQPVTELTRAV